MPLYTRSVVGVQCTWMKDGKMVKLGGRYEVVNTLGICSLEVAVCELSDAGKYTCVAENSQGSEECTCKVTVNGITYRCSPSPANLGYFFGRLNLHSPCKFCCRRSGAVMDYGC